MTWREKLNPDQHSQKCRPPRTDFVALFPHPSLRHQNKSHISQTVQDPKCHLLFPIWSSAGLIVLLQDYMQEVLLLLAVINIYNHSQCLFIKKKIKCSNQEEMLFLISSMINNHIQSCRQAHAVRLMHFSFSNGSAGIWTIICFMHRDKEVLSQGRNVWMFLT